MMAILACMLLAFSQAAFGQAATAAPDLLTALADPVFLAKILALGVGLQILLRGAAEGLTRISVATENRWDNKLAAIVSEVSWVLGAALGKFGYSEPRLVSQEKIDQAAAKATQGG